MKMQTPFTVPQILAMRQWFHKKKIENLESPLGLSAAKVRDAIEDPEYMETIANLICTTRSPTELKKWIETHQRSEKKLAKLAEKFRVSKAKMSELIEQVEDWLTSRAQHTEEYQVKDKRGVRNALEVLKRATLQVLYQARYEGPLQLTAIREQLGTPKVAENSDARDNSLVYGILTHLQDDGFVEYLRSPGWQITPEGVSVIETEGE